MERKTINQSKRKAEQRETSTATKRHQHQQRHRRVEAPRFIGVRQVTATTPSWEVDVAYATPSRPVTPRERQVSFPPLAGRRPTTPSPSPSTAPATAAAGGGEGDGAEACIASLPLELFCNVVAYLGPTSSSLCSLCGVSRSLRTIMTTIGDVMLHRARLRFRVPLLPRTVGGDDEQRGVVAIESSISLFVRHARVSKAVHDRLEGLEGLLRKDFPPSDCDPASDDWRRDRRGSGGRAAAAAVGPSEVRDALNVALCLLGCPDRDCFGDPDLAHLIASHASTTALERRVSAVCGAVGARSYKYAKSRMCRRYDGDGGERFFRAYHAVTDRMVPHHRPSLEYDSDYGEDEDEDEDASVDASEMEADEDMILLDKASMVMQHVFLREQEEMARQRAQIFLH
jgi:hypothetical protein